MGILRDNQRFVVLAFFQPPADQRFLVRSGGGGGEIKDLRHRGTLRSPIDRIPARKIVRRDASLLVCRAGKGHHGPLAGDQIPDLDHVTHGVDGGVLRPQMLVHQDAAPVAQRQPGLPGKPAVGPDADGEYDQLRLKCLTAVEPDRAPAAVVFKGRHAVGEVQMNAVLSDVFMEQLSHLRVQRGHDLIRGLDQRDVKPCMRQVFRHFKADESAADHRGPCELPALHQRPDGVCVRDGPESADPLRVDPRNLRAQGRGAGGDHQIVVGLLVFSAGLQFPDRYGFCFPMDGHRLVANPHVHPEALCHQLRRHQKQGIAVSDHVSHVIGQSAVGIGNIGPALKKHDLPFSVQPAQPSRAACSACDAANDHGFAFFVAHISSPVNPFC